MKALKEIVTTRNKDGSCTQLVKFNGGELITANEYIDQQMRMLALFNMKSVYAFENYEVVITDDGKKLCRKREEPLKMDPYDDGNGLLIYQRQKTKSERLFGRGGKEEDRLELINPQHNLEVGEVASWSI